MPNCSCPLFRSICSCFKMSASASLDLTEEVVENYEDFQKRIKELVDEDPNQRIFVFFTGNPKEDGTSWCPDCRNLEALLLKVLPVVKPCGVLLRVHVGKREDWKTPENPFRTDEKLKLTSIPTLIEWGTATAKRLDGSGVEKECNLEIFFKNE